MQISNFDYALLFLATFAVVGVLTPLARKIAISNQVYDAPNTAHKTHKEPVPYLGGVASFLASELSRLLPSSFAMERRRHFG